MTLQAELRSMLIRVADVLLEAIFPTRCYVCGTFFPRPPEKALSAKGYWSKFAETFPDNLDYQKVVSPFLCPSCSKGFTLVEPPICRKCGFMMNTSSENDPLCARCRTSPPRFRMARAYGVYDQAFRKAIHEFKYREAIGLVRPFELLLFSTFLRHWNPEDIDIILPVPLHITRLRKRGFNQAYVMFRRWPRMAEILNADWPDIQVRPDMLVRTRATESQVGMTQEERQANIRNVFRVRKPS
ncbi:ComF family protein [Desulfonema magnum]|nr:ComF family protein [Desulfonema magnum]